MFEKLIDYILEEHAWMYHIYLIIFSPSFYRKEYIEITEENMDDLVEDFQKTILDHDDTYISYQDASEIIMLRARKYIEVVMTGRSILMGVLAAVILYIFVTYVCG